VWWSLVVAFVLLAAAAVFLTDAALPSLDPFIPTDFLTPDQTGAGATLSAVITDQPLIDLSWQMRSSTPSPETA
jgi:hypothetical protein